MIRSSMREILRRRLNDTAAEQYPKDSQLDDMLNVALTLVQKEILKIRPHAFVQWELYDITKDQQRYPLPVGCLYPIYLGTRASASDTFAKRDRKDFLSVFDGSNSYCYAHVGREVFLGSSLVSSTVATGMRVLHVPTLELSSDASSTEDKGLPRPLDMATIVWAHELLTPETGESRKDVMNERLGLLADLPTYFRDDADGPQVLKLDFVKYPSGVR